MGKTKTAQIKSEAVELTGKEAYEKRRTEKAKKAEVKPDKIHIAGLKGGQRIKTIEAAASVPPTGEEKPLAHREGIKTGKGPKVRSKKYKEAKSKIDKAKIYTLTDAIKLVKETSYASFGGSVELHLVVKKVGTSANVSLPHQAGKAKKIEVASEVTLKKLEAGKIDFDVLLATPEMMPKLVPYARVLGPKGLMPNPKNGTLISDVKKAKDFSTGTILIKTEKEVPLIHTLIGKVGQKDEELIANSQAIFKALGGEKQILKAYAKATMGPSVKVSIG